MNISNSIIWSLTSIICFISFGFTPNDFGWLVAGINAFLTALVCLTYEKRIKYFLNVKVKQK